MLSDSSTRVCELVRHSRAPRHTPHTRDKMSYCTRLRYSIQ